ncbi:MAG TPA: indolepyruvate ferredoxin oxidoreductase family protein [Xanthobacteraceae bacterium]|nr:indolepyruvate ferredoxin oxidoreductase family protein [Xanthobacteraceae bacterium]
MALKKVQLGDKYNLAQERVFVTGYQALVRLCLMQKERDRRAGLNTAGYVTGYRGSPLGGLDQQFQRAQAELKAADVLFQAGLNEELAATALWGSQQAELRHEGRFDGVFGLWYGKGPGVDRTGDVFRHANFAGSSRHGGVLALMGDDHTAESSTTAHQSEYHFIDVMIPILNPAGVQEIIDYGLYGWAMSRFTGAWVALKCMHETVESTAVVDGRLDRVNIIIPNDFDMPEGGLNIRLRDSILGMEARLHDYKRDAMLAFVRANKLNKYIASGGRNPRIGIITTGKSYLDVRQALDELDIDEARCNVLGLRLYKVACPWPISQRDLKEFADGLDLIIVVEEKRSLIEVQVREELYGTANQPICIGKKDERGDWLFPVKGALDPNEVAICIGERLLNYVSDEALKHRVERLKEAQRVLAETDDIAQRIPYFCSGCPHNSSTVVPPGMRAYAGIGCHYMVQWMDRSTLGFTQMGGEGANWIGEAPFSNRPHVYQNIGDGTYNHSGYMAIRAAIAAKVNMTYKVLFNDAVAMTGGQANDGGLTVPQVARQVAAEGAARVVVVTDEPGKYSRNESWPEGLTIHHRDELMAVQEELAKIPGVTVLIYDQTCAAEKRRRRKRHTYPDPDKRVIINELVCEGCGDCGLKSNCVSVQPLETEWGRKRTIDQSSCNKDFSCVNGFCPSFVTVHGAAPKRAAAGGAGEPPALPEPTLPAIDQTYGIIVTGIGGTGIVTIGAIIGMAAHLEGKGVGVLDMAGLAQKGGAVASHIRIAKKPEDIHAIRVAARGADLVLGGDIVVVGTKKVLAAVERGTTTMVVNQAEVLPGEFTRNADYSLPTARLKRAITAASGEAAAHFIDASRIALAVAGQGIAANMVMLGYAYQLGLLPLSAEAIETAIALNGEAVAMNKAAFRWGRAAAADPARVAQLAAPAPGSITDARKLSQSFDEMLVRRVAYLTAYQNAAYAARYRALVEETKAAEATRAPGKCGLAEAVARNLFKLMAYKDEYEVARLYGNGEFARQVAEEFDGAKLRFEFHLAPPLLARPGRGGEPKKLTFGPWMLTLFRLLMRFKFLRGTAFDPFGYTVERRTERKLIADYEGMLAEILPKLNGENHHLVVGIAAIPEKIRGFGHVKMRHLATAKVDEATLMDQFRAGVPHFLKAAE